MTTNSSAFQLPCCLAAIIDCIATGRITFGSSSRLLGNNDLRSFVSCGKTSEEKWVWNWQAPAQRREWEHTYMHVSTWEKFERAVRAAQQLLKEWATFSTKIYFLFHATVLTAAIGSFWQFNPNPPTSFSTWWSWIACQAIFYKAIEKPAKLLKEVDSKLKIDEWCFYANQTGDILGQSNDYDWGLKIVPVSGTFVTEVFTFATKMSWLATTWRLLYALVNKAILLFTSLLSYL